MESKDLLETVGISEEKQELLAYLLGEEGIEAPRSQTIFPRENIEELPLSFSQERLWFLYQLEPESACYNEPAAVRLTGSLNVPALKQGINEIVRRHDVLRTGFTSIEGQPVQVIRETVDLTLPIVELQQMPPDEQNKQIYKLALAEYQQPFDFARRPLMRVRLLRLTPEDHVLLLTMHHSISDGWSVGVFFNELATLYGAFCLGKPSPLPELPIQYVDYAHWQRREFQGESLDKPLAYWKEQLSGSIPILELPSDRPRRPIQTFRGARLYFSFPVSLSDAVKALSRQENATVFMVLLGAFQTLLYRYTGQEDVIVGSPIAGRNWPEVENLIGCFLNTLVLRTDLSGNPSFRELLGRVRDVATGAYTYQDVPFERLVEELHPERDMSRNPLFQVMFVLQNSLKLELPGLSLSPMRLDRGATPFDLILSMEETEQGLGGWWEYNTDLFDDTTIARLAGHFQTMLEGVVADPDQRLSELPLLTEDEGHQLLMEWNDTRADYPEDLCLHHLFEAQVERTPDAIAVVFENERLTYRELNRRANQLAHYLQKLGVGSDVLVGICMERSLEMVIGLLGVLKAGGAYVPLDPEYPKERLAFMIEDSQAPALLTQQRLLEGLPEHAARVIWLDTGWEAIAQESQDNPVSQVKSHNLAYVIYTSGSTGQPKGVMIPHRAICNHMFWMQDQFPLAGDDRVVQKTPFSFDASVWEFYAPLMAGVPLIMARPGGHRDAAYLVSLIAEQQVTVLQLVPSLLQMLLEEEGVEKCRCLRRVFCGGEALAVDLQESVYSRLGVDLHNLYGPTEASIDATFWSCRREPNLRNVPIGRPVSNSEIYLLDSNLNPVPVGIPGELYIGGKGLARGYWNRSALTAEKFLPDPFSTEPGARLYRTGDLARYRPDGAIEFLGRIDHQVKMRGFRIELGEIESVLSRHPAVTKSLVLVREDAPGDQRLVAYIVPNHKQPDESELRTFLKKQLPEYMVPSALVPLESLPLTPNGKVDRRALPEPGFARTDLERTYVAPRDALEVQLTKIWEKVLGHGPIGGRDNFFELGGHSLRAVRVVHQIREVFGKTIPVMALFQAPTVEQLAEVLREEDPSGDWASLVPLQPNGSKPPFFFLAGRSHFGDRLGPDQPVYRVVYQDLDREQPFVRIEDMAAHSIKSVRKIQPDGPYYLGGHGAGGIVAFEMAHQLQRQGQKTALLVLCEIWTRDSRSPTSNTLSAYRLWKKVSYHFHRTRRAGARQELTDLLASLKNKTQGSAERRQSVPLTRAEEDARAAVFEAIGRYVPQVYSGRITVIRCAERVAWRDYDPLDGWGSLATDGVETYEIPGSHTGIYREPNVGMLARTLNDVLHKAQATPESERTALVDPERTVV